MTRSVIGGADGPTAIFLAGELGNLFQIPALLIMILFYGIYFGKQIAGRRQGIRVNRLGEKKEKRLRTTELVLCAATFLIIPVELFSIFAGLNLAPVFVRTAGAVLGILGDGIFLTALLTMRNSWRAGIPVGERTEFVSHGIYSYSRNPAFLGFDLMYVGILLMYFNRMLLVFTVWAVVMLHLQILQEEKYLPTVFGEEYLEYRRRTRRYLGRREISKK